LGLVVFVTRKLEPLQYGQLSHSFRFCPSRYKGLFRSYLEGRRRERADGT
jgi:hypothetical protein